MHRVGGGTRLPRLLLAWLALMLVGCGLPVDPQATFDQARGGEMHIGVVEAPPWTVVEGDQVVGGVEVSLVRALARSIDAQPVFRIGTSEDLGEALSRFDLDILIGGLTADSPWEGRIAFSPIYYTEEFVVARSGDGPDIEDLEGRRVLHPAKQPRAAAWIRSRGGIPAEASGLLGSKPGEARPAAVLENGDLVALPAWRVEQFGLQPVGIRLSEERHVLAIPPGENRMLFEVTEFLSAKGGQTRKLLDEVTR